MSEYLAGPEKLDWFPLYFQRLKASSAWKMMDYQCCWYGKLLIESADSAMPGYLPNDISELWKLAGAKTERFFRQNGGPELLADYFNRTDDGRWIYNERMLNVLHVQNKKLTKRRRKEIVSLSLSIQGLPDWIPEEEFRSYMEMREEIKKPLTPRALKIAVRKLEEFRTAGQDLAMVLQESVFNRWQGLFPVQGSQSRNGHKSKLQESLDVIDKL